MSCKRPVPAAALAAVLFCMLLAGAAFAAELEPPFGIRHYDKGPAPDFSLSDLDGEVFQMKQAQGQWIFLHFWASWCGPCRDEMPAVQELAENLPQLHIVMVNTAEDEDTVFTFLSELDVTLNSLLDSDGLVTEDWKPRGLPSTFLINPQGEIKYQAIGGRDWGKTQYLDFLRQLTTTP